MVTFLEGLELGHLAARFRADGVDGALLAELSTEEMVSELGLSKLQAKKVAFRFPK